MTSRAPPVRRPPPTRSVPPAPSGTISCTSATSQEDSRRRAAPPPVPPRRPTGNDVDHDKARLIARKPPPRPAPAIPRRLPSLNASNQTSLTRPVPPPRPQGRPPLPARKGTPHDEDPSQPAFALASQRRLPPPLPLVRGSTPPAPPPPINLATKPSTVPYSEPVDDTVCIKCYDFSQVDDHASRFPRHTITTLPALARDLTEPFVSETEKARAIYTWLSHNIVYDVQSFMSGNIQPATPDSTVRSGAAVCDGYAGLFMHLAQLAGISGVIKVTGHGKGFGYRALQMGQPVPPPYTNHAWNRIRLDGEWRLIDPCWGAGTLNGTTWDQGPNPYWFSADPVEFGKQHYPTDPNDQCRDPLVSWCDYIAGPEHLPTIYGEFYTQNFDIQSLRPQCDCITSGEHLFFLSKRCSHMSGAEPDNFVPLISTGDDTRSPMVADGSGSWSATVYVPSGSDVTLYYVKTIDGRDAKGLTVAEYRWNAGRKAMGFGGLAKWNHA